MTHRFLFAARLAWRAYRRHPALVAADAVILAALVAVFLI